MLTVAARRLTAMTAGFAAINTLNGVTTLIGAVMIARGRGADALGAWTLGSAWAATIYAVSDLGFGVLIPRDAASAPAHVGRLVANALAVRTIAAVMLAVGLSAGASAAGFPSTEPALLGATIALGCASVLYGTVAAGLRIRPSLMMTTVVIECTGAAIVLLGIGVALTRDGSVAHVLWLTAGVQAGQFACACAVASTTGASAVERPDLRGMLAGLQRAWPFALAGLAANAQVRLAPLVLGALSAPAQVAQFGAAWRVVSLGRVLPHAALGGALPILAADAAHGGNAAPQERLAGPLFERALSTVAVLSSVALAAAAGPIAVAVYGPAFAEARTAMVWLAVGLAPALINAARRVALSAAGAEAVALRWLMVALVVQVTGCAVLIPAFGASGAAAALTLGEATVWWPLRRTRVRTFARSSPHREQ